MQKADGMDYLSPERTTESEQVERAGSRRSQPILGGVGVGFGIAFGGESLITMLMTDGSEQHLNAGQGVVGTLRAFAMPLWPVHELGLGIGLEWGYKFTSINASNAGFSLRRFPVEVTARALLRLTEHVHVVCAGGLHYEYGVTIAGTGAIEGLELHLNDALGGTAELGLLFSSESVGVDVTTRYTGLKYTLGGESAGASQGGLFSGLFVVF